MAQNYASDYSNLVDERFKVNSYTEVAINRNYDFTGVNTVNVYSIPTAPQQDYKMTGKDRYGDPEELGSSIQTLTMAQDRSFTFTIDRRNYEDTMMVMESGKALRRQLDEVSIPETDQYRLSVITAGAGTTVTSAIDSPYDAFLDGITTLLDAKVPIDGTVAFIGSNFYKKIRLDRSFILPSEMAQDMLVKGAVGAIENIPLIHVPKSYLVPNTEFIITNPIACTAPTKIEEYSIHENPVGISGWLAEGRFYYDAFILDNKKDAIYVHKGA